MEDARDPATVGILHADLDSFFASVEQRDDPSLRGRPVAVGGGVVLAASYEARAYGVRTAMAGRQARALCPGLVVVPARFEDYTRASREVYAVFDDTSPLVEGVSIDEAYLDVSGLARLRGDAYAIGARLRADVRERVGLRITVGAARTRFLAKMASRAAKPDGLMMVTPAGEDAFLHPLAVDEVWGVGEATAARLHRLGLHTVRDLVDVPRPVLARVAGPQGALLHTLVTGADPRSVRPGRRRRGIGSQRALGRRPRTPAELDATLVTLVERVARRLRAGRRTARTVVLRLRFDDFDRATRSHTLSTPTDDTDLLLRSARRLFAGAGPLLRRRGLTLVGITLTGLEEDADRQPPLPYPGRDRTALGATVDALCDRFGADAVSRAAVLGHGHRPAVPVLPD